MLKGLTRVKINTIAGILGIGFYYGITFTAVKIYAQGDFYPVIMGNIYIVIGIIVVSLIIEMIDGTGRLRLINSGLYIGLLIYLMIMNNLTMYYPSSKYTIALAQEYNSLLFWFIFISIIISFYVLTNYVTSAKYLNKGAKNSRSGTVIAKMQNVSRRLYNNIRY